MQHTALTSSHPHLPPSHLPPCLPCVCDDDVTWYFRKKLGKIVDWSKIILTRLSNYFFSNHNNRVIGYDSYFVDQAPGRRGPAMTPARPPLPLAERSRRRKRAATPGAAAPVDGQPARAPPGPGTRAPSWSWSANLASCPADGHARAGRAPVSARGQPGTCHLPRRKAAS